MKSGVFAVFILCAALVFVSSRYGSAEEKGDAKLLLEKKCGTCHSVEKPKSQKKTKGDWETTVMRMKNVNMAPISSKEAKTIIDYLATHYGK
jgi:hypothetical protein